VARVIEPYSMVKSIDAKALEENIGLFEELA
jgi:hypothetical protein